MSSILAIGYSTEGTFKYFVSRCLKESIINVDVLDLSKIAECQIVEIIEEGDQLVILLDDQTFDFSNYFGFYNRCFFSSIGYEPKDFALSKVVSAVNSYLETTKKFVINKHSSGAINGNKFIHIYELEKFGFQIPQTFICGTKESLYEAKAKHSNLINKSCSSVKTIAAVVDDELLKRAENLKYCPSLFQRRIVGPDVRVHLVGEELFAEKIISDSIDYRFSSAKNSYSSLQIPDYLSEKCISYCKKEKLSFAGIDFKVEGEDNWYILEINPMPGYEGYDKRLEGRISKALFNLFKEQEILHSDYSDQLFVSNDRRPDVQAL